MSEEHREALLWGVAAIVVFYALFFKRYDDDGRWWMAAVFACLLTAITRDLRDYVGAAWIGLAAISGLMVGYNLWSARQIRLIRERQQVQQEAVKPNFSHD